MTERHIGPKGLALIKRNEGLRLKAYRCPAGIPTIGYGSTGAHVHMGMTITEEEAEALLRRDLERFERGVSEMAGEMTPGQFSALVSFAFNLGIEALRKSTLLRKHLAGDYAGAALEFAKWNRGGGRVLPGLVTRRADEAELYRLPA
jgi:lysozyme